MNRKERRVQLRLEERQAKKIIKKEREKIRNTILKDYCRRFTRLTLASTLLAIKDELNVDNDTLVRIVERLNSILEESNDLRINEMLDLVQDELEIDLHRA